MEGLYALIIDLTVTEVVMLGKPNRAARAGYVSEFTRFIDAFLKDHSEVVDDQKKGWDIYWDHKVDFDALKRAEEDSVPFVKTMPESINRQEQNH